MNWMLKDSQELALPESDLLPLLVLVLVSSTALTFSAQNPDVLALT
jgi:hypothetical protein